MRVNIYSQELTSEVIHVAKESNTGVVYHAAQLVLHSSPMLHHPGTKKIVTGLPCYPNGMLSGKPREQVPYFLVEIWEGEGRPDYLDATNPYREVREESVSVDDDRSAVTFWLPKSQERREEMATAFEEIAKIFRNAPKGTGL